MQKTGFFVRLIAIALFLVQSAHAQEFSLPPDRFNHLVYAVDLVNNPPTNPNSNGYGDQLPLTEDDSWTDMCNNPTSWNSKFNLLAVNDFIRVRIDSKLHATTAFKYLFTFLLYQYTNPSSPTTASGPISVPIELDYDPATGAAYNDHNEYRFANCHSFYVTLDNVQVMDPTTGALQNIARTDFSSIFSIETEVSALRCDAQIPPNFLTNSKLNTTSSQMEVYWGYSNSYNGGLYPGSAGQPTVHGMVYELEWTYIDNYTYNLGTKTAGSAFPQNSGNSLSSNFINYSFNHNATRIRTNKSSYNIPYAYERGVLLYRVRVLQPDVTYTTLAVKSGWTMLDNGLTTDCTQPAFAAKGQLINQAFEGDKLNWQYSVSFAEDGKYKHSINYFDGLNKNRQNITWLNSLYNGNASDYVIAQENIYDKEGRPSIKTLPIPVTVGTLQYIPGFATVNGGTPLNATLFDVPAASCAPILIPALDPSALANSYYSHSSANQAGMLKYLPDAKGYPYIQTIYSPDNTNKVQWQGGAGDVLQPWAGHATRMEYVRADQFQLDHLFGTEAGTAEYYPKQIVTDPNGQVSFSIYNPAGKIMATGLSGNNPADATSSNLPIFSLPSKPTTPNFTLKELIAGVSPQILGNTVYQTGSFYNEVDAGNDALVSHTATLPVYSLCNKYLLPQMGYSVRIMDQCGTPVYTYPLAGGTVPIGSTTPFWGTMPTASATTASIALTPFNHLINNSLLAGKYTAQSSLTADDDAMRSQVTAVFDASKGSRHSDACFLNETEFIHDAIENETFPCHIDDDAPTSDCDALKKLMIAEMWPGAKYGQYTKNSDNSLFFNGADNSIFTSVPTSLLTGAPVAWKFDCNKLPFQITTPSNGVAVIDNLNSSVNAYHTYTNGSQTTQCATLDKKLYIESVQILDPTSLANISTIPVGLNVYSAIAPDVFNNNLSTKLEIHIKVQDLPTNPGCLQGIVTNNGINSVNTSADHTDCSSPNQAFLLIYKNDCTKPERQFAIPSTFDGYWLTNEMDINRGDRMTFVISYEGYTDENAFLCANNLPDAAPCTAGLSFVGAIVPTGACVVSGLNNYVPAPGVTAFAPYTTTLTCDHGFSHIILNYPMSDGNVYQFVDNLGGHKCGVMETQYRYQSACVTYPSITVDGIKYGNNSVTNINNNNGTVTVTSTIDIHTLTPDQFIHIFNDQIAEAILSQHPEFCKLQSCDHYSDDITAVTSYAQGRQ